jgi:O-acetyl-ADP-ribose deacetylase
VDGAIHRAAGPGLLEECRALNGCETGQAKITGGYRLPCKYVIHTPGPIWRGGKFHEEELLRSCYLSSLRLAERYGCKTVAFPSISTGIYRFPLQKAAAAAVDTVLEFLKQTSAVQTVLLVCFDEKTKRAYDGALTNSNEDNPLPE